MAKIVKHRKRRPVKVDPAPAQKTQPEPAPKN